MAIAIGDIFRGTVRYVMAGQVCVNVMHYRATQNYSTGTFSRAALDSHLNSMTSLANAMASIAHDSVMFIDLHMITAVGQFALYERKKDLNVMGGSSGELLPSLLALPLHLRTEFAGRSRRGRMHIGGWTEADQDAGYLVGPGITKLDSIKAAVTAHLVGPAPFRGIVYSRKIGSLPGAHDNAAGQIGGQEGVPWAWIDEVQAGTLIGTMYSRKIGKGS